MPLASLGRAQFGGRGKEAASAEHTRLTNEDRPRLFQVVSPLRWVRRHRIVAPLPGVAEHVKHSQVVRLQTPHAPVVGVTIVLGVVIEQSVGAAVGTARYGPGT